jgi:hypothetical protein
MTSVTGRLPSQDGAVLSHAAWQQHLVAPKVKLGLAEMLLRRDPEKAAATLEQLKGDADEALETLHDLKRLRRIASSSMIVHVPLTAT